MCMYYFVPSDLGQIINVALQKGVLPRPMGVGIKYIIRSDIDFFGFDTYNGTSNVKSTGFTTYADFGTKVGKTLSNNNLQGV